MAVKRKNENDNLVLTLDNGDRTKFDQVLKDWRFKDEQSLVRFFLSVFIESEDKRTIGYIKDGVLKSFTPNPSLIDDKDGGRKG